MDTMLNKMINTVNAIHRGYIEVTEEEYNLLKKELSSITMNEKEDSPILLRGYGSFMGIRVYMKGKNNV